MSDHEAKVQKLIDQATEAISVDDALKFSQAACNAVNALRCLNDITKEIASLKAQLEQKQADIERIGSVYNFAAKEAEIVLLRSERDALDKSHADLAHRLADAGREIASLRAALDSHLQAHLNIRFALGR